MDETDVRSKREKGACGQEKSRLQTGKKARGGSLSPHALTNKGGRPYILEHPPLYVGAVGRNRVLFL